MPILDWRQLREAVKKKQAGKAVDPNNPIYLDEPDDATKAAQWTEFVLENDAISKMSADQKHQMIAEEGENRRRYIDELYKQGQENDFGGYGESRFDKRVPYETWVEDPVNYRANAQSAMSKFLNGTLKMIPYAATTFIDNTLGLLGGLAAVGDDWNNGGDFSGTRSFINNPISEMMQNVRDWSEENLPNYRTTEETEDQDHWWRHLNANFFGDVFLKNLGFTIGAAASGYAFSKGFQALMPKIARQGYRAGVAAANGDERAAAGIRKMMQGASTSAEKVYNDLKNAVDTRYKMGIVNQIIAGVGGAMGESRVEAMGAAKEFRDEMMAQEQERYDMARQYLIQEIQGNSSYIGEEPVYDGFGNKVGTRRVLNQDGRDALMKGLAELEANRNKAQAAIDKKAEDVAYNTFWLNMPLLAGENVIMFGRLFSGGFRSQAKAKVKGRLGDYSGKSLTGQIAKRSGKAMSEGIEEITQKVFSEGSKDFAKSKMADFYNGAYDKQALEDSSGWVMSMLNSTGDVLSSPSSWQEFAVGLLTGGISDFVTSRGYADSREDMENSSAAAEKLNNKVRDPEFRNRWMNLVRHNYYERKKDEALDKNDSYAWHGLNDAQIINDVMMFEKAGRLNDLESFVDDIVDADIEQVRQIRGSLLSEVKNEDTGKIDNELANKSDKEVQEWLQKRARDVKKTIGQIRDFRNALDVISLGTSDEKVLDEMVYSLAQLENFEDRYTRLSDEVLKKIRPAVENAARQRDSNGNPTKQAELAQHLLENEDTLRGFFGGLVADVEGRIQDSRRDMGAMLADLADQAKQDRNIELLEQWGAFTKDPSVKKEVQDLQRLIRGRQLFYAKIYFPQFRQAVEEQAKTNNGVANNLKKDARMIKVDGFMQQLAGVSNMKSFLNTYNSFDKSDSMAIDMLNERIEKDPNLKKYVDVINAAETFHSNLVDGVNGKPDGIAKQEVLDYLNNYSIDNLLISMGDGLDAAVVMGQDMLDTFMGSQEAHDMLRSVILDKLGNKAQSVSSGTVPQTNQQANQQANQQTQSQPQQPSQPQESEYDKLTKRIVNAVSLRNIFLNDILAGNFSKYGNFTEQERQDLFNLALQKEKELKEARGMIATSDDEAVEKASIQDIDNQPIDNQQRRTANEEFKRKDTKTVRGSQFSFWDIPSLVKGIVKRFVGKKAGVNDTMNWYDAHHVQQFIDSGALALLEEHHRINGKRLPVYFLGNPHFVENNTALNPFATEKTKNVVFAVEMTKENRDLLAKHEKAGVFTDSTLIEVEGKKYQVLGVMPDYAATLDFEEAKADPESYEKSVNEAGSMWEATMQNSILQQYQADTANGGDINFPREGRWYIAKSGDEPVSTTINYISSGRNETRVEGGDYTRHSVKEALSEYKALGGEVHFALHKDPLSETPIVTTPGAPEFPKDINAPVGSLWMATREANGQWAWTYITVARTNEFDFEANKDSVTVKSINKAFDVLFEKVNVYDDAQRQIAFDEKLQAVRALQSMIYLGVNNRISFEILPDGNVHAYIGNMPCDSMEEAINILKKNKYRFQVDSIKVEHDDLKRLIDDGILRTEMRSFVRKGASFGVNYLSDKDNTSQTAFTAGQDNATENTSSAENIRIDDVGYTVMPDGTVYMTGSNGTVGQQVDDPGLVAQVKALEEAVSLLDPNPQSPNILLKQRHSDQWFALYPGRSWRIDSKNEYIELFEREIDGVKVRMIKRGENGAILPLYDDAEWNQLVSSAEEVGIPVQEEQPEVTQSEKPSPKKLTGGLKSRLMKSAMAKDSSAPTVQQNDQNESKKEDEIDCG